MTDTKQWIMEYVGAFDVYLLQELSHNISRVDKRFFRPVEILRWVVVIYEQQRRFGETAAREMINGLVASCSDVGTIKFLIPGLTRFTLFLGIKIKDTPFITWENGQGRIADQLRAAGAACAAKMKAGPNLVVVILPEGGNDIYTAVKQYAHLQSLSTDFLTLTVYFLVLALVIYL